MEDKKEIRLKIQQRFASLINKLRKERNLSIRQLATESDLEFSQVQRLCKGEVNVALSTIIKLAKGFNITPSEMLRNW